MAYANNNKRNTKVNKKKQNFFFSALPHSYFGHDPFIAALWTS